LRVGDIFTINNFRESFKRQNNGQGWTMLQLNSRGNPSFKNLDYEKFDSAEEWNKIRKFAMETLTLIGEPLEKPDIKYI